MRRLAVFVDGGPADRDVLASATAIATRAGAHLDVLYPWNRDHLKTVLPPEANKLAQDLVGPGGQNAARNAFDSMCLGRPNTRWVNVSGHLDDAIRAFGLHYDAVFLKRPPEETGPCARAFNTALFETGAPVVIAPPRPGGTTGERIAIVWSGTPQSSRAMRTAMPMLRTAKEVHLLTNSANHRAEPDLAIEYLRINEVEAAYHPFGGGGLTARGRGRAIIEAARAVSADLLIVGGFGENQIDALFGLGRTTRKLVTATPVPLMLQS